MDIKYKLGFFKLIVTDIDLMAKFFSDCFSFVRVDKIETFGFVEYMLVLPKGDFMLVLYQYKDGREIQVGSAHGPVGIVTNHVDGAYEKALMHGGVSLQAPIDFGPARLAFIATPEGHEIELFNPKAEKSKE